jgi:ATP-dependent DNA helicase RecQ
VTDVLCGRDTKKIRRFGHKDVSTYGIGSDRSKSEWRSILRQLVAKGLVRVDITGYGALKLTEACRPVLEGDETVELRKDPTPTKPKDGATKTATSRATALETDADEALFEALRETRSALAKEQEVPPYVIFNDTTLLAMVEERPDSLDAFRDLHGVGDVKLERYGETFLDVIREHAASV